MSKRKKAPPKRVDEEKRSRLTWNMGDGDRSLQIIDDEDPSLMFEQQGASNVLGWDSLLMQANSSNSPIARSDTTALPVRSRKAAKTTPLTCVEETKTETVINIEEDSQEPKKVYENYFVDEDDERLNQSLKNCHAMVEVHSTSGLDGSNWQCEVGSFKISVLQPNDVESRIGQCISVPDVEKFWLYGSEIPGCSILYYEFNAREDQENSGFVWKKKFPFLNRMRPVNQRKVLYYLANTDLPFEILEAVHSAPNQKHFRFVCKGYSDKSNEVEVAIYLQEAGLSSVQHPSEQPSKSRALQDIYKLAQAMMSYFYGIGLPDSDFTGKRFSRKHDIKDFFRNIKEIHEKTPPELRLDVQHPTLKPVLRPYQKQGVLWMLQNERYKDEEKAEEEMKGEVVHQLYEEVTMKDGQHLFYNKTGGIFVKAKPKSIINPPGGLLADEMGLGKTVEVLACMLLNPRKDLKEPGSPCAVKTWVKDRVISPKKEVTSKAEDTTAKDPLDVDSRNVTPVPFKDVPSLNINETIRSDSSLPPEDGSISMKDDKEETLPASGYDEGLFKDCSSTSGDVVVTAKETVSNRKLSEDTVKVDKDTIDNGSKVTKRASVPTTSVIQLGPTGNFGSLGGTSILKQSVVLMKSHSGGSTQLEKSSNDALGDGLDKLKDKSGNDDTIPFGDSMAEYDLSVLDGGMNESSRWDFWLKRKQVVLERPKKFAVCEKLDIAQDNILNDAQSLDCSNGCVSSGCDIPADSVAIDSSGSQRIQGTCMDPSVIKQNGSKLTLLESGAQDQKQGSNMSLELSGQSILTQSEKCGGAQGRSSQDVQGLDSSLSAGELCAGNIQGGGKRRKKKKKVRSKSMSHVLVATACHNVESQTEGHKTSAGLDKTSDGLTTKCDMSVVCSERQNGVSTGMGAEVLNGRKGKRKVPSGTKKGPLKETRFEYFVPVDEMPSPVKGFPKKAEQKEFFECVCGQKAVDFDRKLRVQCDKCGLWQHAECVGYDVEDPSRGDYKCPHCHVISPPISSGATLIISPNAICHQWVEEIHKHVKEEKLKVFVYGGVYKHRFIQPQTLANHDIVITTYETLSREINYVDLPHSNSEKGRRLRHPKRFMAIPSPIVAVEWWRICLDEAQMVECTTTRTAEMALRLSAVNRWCVTGTPIHHDLADLYGLLLFLGVDPYWVKHWWDTMLYNPYCYGQKEPMHQAIAKVLWRTSKVDVIDQLGLPTQSEKIHWLKFSPIEEHFYRQQYEHHYKQATNMLMKWSDNRKKLSSLDRHTLHWLLNPLVNLRQACCHPQAVRGAFLNVNKTTMTMEEILTQLTKKSKTECEESHRQMVAAMNGTAAIHIIKEECIEAVEVYRDVLRAVVEHENQIRTDKIQQLHTLHNLDEILSLGVEGVGRTLRDDQLKPQCKEIKEEYLAKAVANVVVAHEALEAVQENIQELSAELEGGVNWWADVIQYALAAGLDDVLVDRVRSELQDTSSLGRDSLAYKFRNVNGMEYVLNILLEQLEEAHDNLTVSLTELDDEPTPNSVEEAVVCCLRPAGEVRKTCCFCKADELFSVYESKLFSFKEQQVFANVQEDGQYSVTTKRQGTWADSELEKAIKILASFTRHIAADASLSEYGSIHMKVFDALKKEFKCLRNKWLYLRERVSAIDELNMATTRYRLRLPGEEPTDPPQPNVLDPVEVDVTKSKLSADKAIAESELRKKLGQLIYLRNLEKAHDHLEGGSNPEACPICQKELGDEWSVMRCGHFFCMDCIHIMLNDYSFGLRRKSLKCAICRNISLHSEISYVSLKKTSNTEEGEECFQVKGDHSTKVTAVVRCLKQIQLNDPGAKALVFSTWQEVLNVIAQGLRQNNIGFKSLHAQNKFQANLHSFRSDDDVSVLLLPVHSGANGLNLIEATHILLVEPVLNQAQELQAIGRIHRIGQTKPTFVHRFIVKATIEEKMHSMLKSIQLPIDSHNDEESNLTIGDLWSLFSRRDVEGEEEGESSDGASGIRPDLGGESNDRSVPDDGEQPPSPAEGSRANLSLESDRPTGSVDIDELAVDTIPLVSEHVTI